MLLRVVGDGVVCRGRCGLLVYVFVSSSSSFFGGRGVSVSLTVAAGYMLCVIRCFALLLFVAVECVLSSLLAVVCCSLCIVVRCSLRVVFRCVQLLS